MDNPIKQKENNKAQISTWKTSSIFLKNKPNYRTMFDKYSLDDLIDARSIVTTYIRNDTTCDMPDNIRAKNIARIVINIMKRKRSDKIYNDLGDVILYKIRNMKKDEEDIMAAQAFLKRMREQKD